MANCFRFAPRDSVPGLIAKICKYLKDHSGWSEEELKQFIAQNSVESFNDRTGAVVLNENDVNKLKIASAYFAEGDETIDDLDLVGLYNQGVRFVFTNWNSVTSGYDLSYVIDYFDGSNTAVYYPVTTGSSGDDVLSVNGETGDVVLGVVDVSDADSVNEYVKIFVDESEEYPIMDIDAKANVIIDTSEKAPIHTLYAQDGPMKVKLYGESTETGSGDKSPDNPYSISGVSTAKVQVTGKNILPLKSGKSYGVTAVVEGDGIRVSGSPTGNARIFLLGTSLNKGVVLPAGTYTLSLVRDDSTIAIRAYRTKDTIQLAQQGGTFTLEEPTEVCVFLYAAVTGGDVNEQFVYPQLELGSVITEYEPYIAKSIDMPLLPDDSSLYGGDGAYDTVDNDIKSGYDASVTFDGSEDEYWLMLSYTDSPANVFRIIHAGAVSSGRSNHFYHVSDTYYNMSKRPGSFGILYNSDNFAFAIDANTCPNVSAWRSYLAANNETVYYKTANYTPEKDIRVTNVTRRWEKLTLVGDETEIFDVTEASESGKVFFLYTPTTPMATVDSNYSTVNIYCNYLPIETAANTARGVQSISADVNERFRIAIDGITTVGELRSYLSSKNLEVIYPIENSRTYLTDSRKLRKPTGIMPVTVTGSGETEVEYPHDTKHYIDQKFDALSAALIGG